MTYITIAIKFGNRTFSRYYEVTADADFNTLKDAIKATGAKFDGAQRVWNVNKAGLDTLKSQYELKPADFYLVNNLSDVEFKATGSALTDKSHLNELRDAYNKSDEAFLKVAAQIGLLHTQTALKMLKAHQDEQFVKDLIAAEKARMEQ
jgi:hypothetical protein